MAAKPVATPYALQRIAANANTTLRNHAVFEGPKMFAEVLKVATPATSKQLVALATAFEKGLVPRDKTKTLHQQLGEGARVATLTSYDAHRAQGGPSGYRPNDRFSGGVLRGVLASRSFYRATPSRLSLVDSVALNNKAWQWRRLNFGAGAAGAASPRSRMYRIQVSNVILAEVGLVGKPRPGFRIPGGYWRAGEFHPYSGAAGVVTLGDDVKFQKPMVTRGIRAEHFLDAGVAYVANNFGPSYMRLLDELVKDGTVKVRTRTMTPPVVHVPPTKIPKFWFLE